MYRIARHQVAFAPASVAASLRELLMNMRRPLSHARVKRLCRVLYGLLAVLTVPLVTVGVSHLKPASFSVNDATVRIGCAEP
jgi:hypothetical protein